MNRTEIPGDVSVKLKNGLSSPMPPVRQFKTNRTTTISFLDSHARIHSNAVNISKGRDGRNDSQSLQIGWGTDVKVLCLKNESRAIPDMPHKRWWDHEKSHFFTKTTGYHGNQLDSIIGFTIEDLEGLSIRRQRDII
jgi:hypothetical protein